jgi:hypothetical protein
VIKAVLFAAMLSGLCAEAIAAPTNSDWIGTTRASLDSIDRIPADFSLTSPGDHTLFRQITRGSEPEWISTGLGLDVSPDGAQVLFPGGREFSGTVRRAPEPPALSSFALGVGCIGLSFSISRFLERRKGEARRHGRHRVRVPMREYGLSSGLGTGSAPRVTAKR